MYTGSHFPKKLRESDYVTAGSASLGATGGKDDIKVKIAKRAVHELKPCFYCNLGIGIPTLIGNFVIGKVDMDL